MPENPHENENLPLADEKSSEIKDRPDAGGAWSEDQRRRGYYYDDAAGYEIYVDDDEIEEDAGEEIAQPDK